MTSNRADRTLRLVATAYGAAIRPERFEELLTAWDEWFDDVIENSEQAFDEVSTLFDDALLQSDHLRSALPSAWEEQSPVPTILVDRAGEYLTANKSAKNLFDEEGLDAAQTLAQRTATTEQYGSGKHRTFRLAGGTSGRRFLAVEASVSSAMTTEYPDAQTAFYLSLMDWPESFEAEMVQQLDLSAAELRVARGLFEGRTAQEISDDLGRSLPTIRSHIKVLLQKTGTRRQTELVQFLTILRQVSVGATSERRTENTTEFEQTELTGPSGRLQVIRYGAGKPVLYFTTSSRPEESAGVRNALSSAGLRIIAPARPGFGESDPVEGDTSSALLDEWLDMLLALTGPNPVLAGHREGGIVAAQAAQRILSRGDTIAGLALISTGAPARDLAQFENTPASIRRSFLGAHIAAPALRLGYKTAARLYKSSAVGQDKIIRFFHKDSPADRRKLVHPEFYEITRDLLSYCFQNTDQIVRDIALWGSDWSEALDAVSSAVPTIFIHGTDHVFHLWENIEGYAERIDRVSICPVHDAGQLALYECSGVVAEAIAELVTSNGPRAKR